MAKNQHRDCLPKFVTDKSTIFRPIEIQMVILRCWTGLKLNWFKMTQMKNTKKTYKTLHSTGVRFGSFLAGGFITAIVLTPPERKLAKCTSVHRLGFFYKIEKKIKKMEIFAFCVTTFDWDLEWFSISKWPPESQFFERYLCSW